ncbi:DUF2267 domain-containing protein [Halopiger xanaduensis]|uniref:DUF2267 domain-containing protein n=1 Tax=Halopiger xanaduensis (strain DSM 18323 / JCM 14033 / SH-6) TaxID=797210 RepID=F8D4K1_HALXS|nr:DUF2267 domain-containing protein [Halopiger xanaduensis]AEH36329.1 Protein of unknown function DUF2267 [Halopiger xanaduensis SH-6]
MQEDEFYGLVQQAGHLESTDRTQAATEAVLETLGETMTGGEAGDVAEQLPTELASVIEDADHDGAGYDREEFVERVGEHLRGADLESDDAEQYADAVTDALAVALTGGELENLKSQLDSGLHPLFEGVTIDQEDV